MAEDKKRNRKKLTAGGKTAGETVEVISAGRVLSGRYELKREVARGGMGIVFEACDKTLNDHRVAVKVLPPEMATNEAAIVRLKDEALSAIKLTHANIMRLHSFEEDGDVCFLVMEYLDGETLELELANRKKLPLEEVIEIGRQAAEALNTAHTHNLVHRDIKPANLMFTTVGEKRLLKVTDFGIAYEIKDSMTRLTGTQASLTPQYASPEQLQAKRLDGRTDQYSLAITLYELLEGRPPFGGAGLTYQIINAEAEPVEGVPEHVNAALKKAMAKNPEERFTDCLEFIAALSGEKPVVATPAATGAQEKTTASPLVPIVVGMLLVAAVGYHFSGGNKAPGPKPTVAPTTVVATATTPQAPRPTTPPTVAPTKVAVVTPPTKEPTPTPEPTKLAVVVPPTPTKPAPPTKVELHLMTNPLGAKVFCKEANSAFGRINEERVESFSPGTYTFVALGLPGYRRYEKRHVIGKNGPVRLTLQLEKEEALLRLDGLFPGCQVRLDDRVIRETQWQQMTLKPKRYHLNVTAEGHHPYGKDIVLKDRDNKRVLVKMEELPQEPQTPWAPADRPESPQQMWELLLKTLAEKNGEAFQQLWAINEPQKKGAEFFEGVLREQFSIKLNSMRHKENRALFIVDLFKNGKLTERIICYLEELDEGWRYIDWNQDGKMAEEFVPLEGPKGPDQMEKPFHGTFNAFVRALHERNIESCREVCDPKFFEAYGRKIFEVFVRVIAQGGNIEAGESRHEGTRGVIVGHFDFEGNPTQMWWKFEERPQGWVIVAIEDSEATVERWLAGN